MPQISISLAGILKIPAGLDPSKTAGPDVIKPVVLRSLKDQVHVAPTLQIIFQQSLNTGQIPSDWKKAIVTPLFKKGDKCDPAKLPASLTNLHLLQTDGTHHCIKPHKASQQP